MITSPIFALIGDVGPEADIPLINRSKAQQNVANLRFNARLKCNDYRCMRDFKEQIIWILLQVL